MDHLAQRIVVDGAAIARRNRAIGRLGILGLIEVIKEPEVLAALSPHHAITFCATYKLAAFIALGSVVLAVTGAEALYADMGHFGARPIRFAWLWFVIWLAAC